MKVVPLMPKTCLDSERDVCHFEIHPDTIQKTALTQAGQGFVCLRTACASVKIDNKKRYLLVKNHSNFCICNIVNIVGCDFTYSVPVVSHQLIKTNYKIYHPLSSAPIGINLTLVKHLIKDQDLSKILRKMKENGEKILITVLQDAKEISRALQNIK